MEKVRAEKKAKRKKAKRNRKIITISLSIFGAIAAVVTAYNMSPIAPFKYNMATSTGIPENTDTISLVKLNKGVMPGVASIAFKERTEEDVLMMMTDDDDEAEGSGEGTEKKEKKSKPRIGQMMYASVADGKLVEMDMSTGEVETVLHTGETARLAAGWECGSYYTESYCGRPMGMAFDHDGLRLYIADAYTGLFRVNVDERTKEKLTDTDNEGKKLKFLNGVTVSKTTGRVYITESSVKFRRRDSHRLFLQGGPSGRILMYDPADGGLTVLSKSLFFPTGIVVVPNAEGTADDHLLITEAPRARIRKYKIPTDAILSDPEIKVKGKLSVWKDGLPIYPTDIYWSGDATNAQLVVTGTQRIQWLDTFSTVPMPRKMLGMLTEYWLDYLLPRKSVVMKINRNGRITKTKYLDSAASTAYPYQNKLYTTSNRYWEDGVKQGEGV